MVERLDGGIMKLRDLRRDLYNSREDLWDEYCRLRKEVKELVAMYYRTPL